MPGREHHFLVNPYGLTFDEITASSLVKVDLDGTKVMDLPYEINPAGFTIHSAIHAARDDAKCVLHVHSINGTAVSAQQNGVLPISQQSIFVLASLGYHDYEGVALRADEKPRLVRDLGKNSFFMLRNHGPITVADNVPDAFLLMYTFESACMIQVRAQAGGGKLTEIDARIIATAQQQAAEVTNGAVGALAGRRCCASSTGSTLHTGIEQHSPDRRRAVQNATSNRARFNAMNESTYDEWQLIGGELQRFAQRLPERLIAHLELLRGDYGGFPVDRLEHCLQTATRALQAGRDEEYVACALLHDIGDTVGPYNHADVAAVIVHPFVSEENHWMVEHHAMFQGTTSSTSWGSIVTCEIGSAGIRISLEPRNFAACSIKSPSTPISNRCRLRHLNQSCRECSVGPGDQSTSPRRRNREACCIYLRPAVCAGPVLRIQ